MHACTRAVGVSNGRVAQALSAQRNNGKCLIVHGKGHQRSSARSAGQGVPGSLLNNPWGMTLRDVLRKVDKVDRKQMFPPCSHKNRHSGNEEYLVKLNT